ncbi:putative phosphatidate phosphatase [Rosa chinensis]|uniref:Putative phosphatidate phosphatase n=1 Tax=Rosa chinensis TaxID=74649 RepID=A0A2P6RMA2_ROSCH|nr:putative phosphatidate phosphatase [Rosa chinensis]
MSDQVIYYILGLNQRELKEIYRLCISYYLSLQSWIPVSHRLHTLSQVIVGGTLGTIFSILWYWSWNVAVHEPYVFRLLGSNS